jgi:beta-lactamase class D
MSATKQADNLFLNETKLLVRNDRTKKRNNALNNLNNNTTSIDDDITLAKKKENSLWLLNDRIAQRAENPAGDFITKSYYGFGDGVSWLTKGILCICSLHLL